MGKFQEPNMIRDYYFIMMSDERLGDKVHSLEDKSLEEVKAKVKALGGYYYFIKTQGIEIDDRVYIIHQSYREGFVVSK